MGGRVRRARVMRRARRAKAEYVMRNIFQKLRIAYCVLRRVKRGCDFVALAPGQAEGQFEG